jgi:carbon monoxide dehydrogenase subunit G
MPVAGTSSCAIIAPPESSALTRITISIPPKTSRSSRTLRTLVCIGAGAAMNFKTAIRIERPIEEVFDYVSDPVNFPHWNSAVQSVRGTSPGEAAGATYLMERDLPGGKAENELAIVVWNRPAEFTIRTTSGPTPFTYQYRFADEGGATLVELKAEVELAGIAGALGPLASPAVKRGVDANFAELKRILEGGPNDLSARS